MNAQEFMGLARTQLKLGTKQETLPPPSQQPGSESFPTSERFPTNEQIYESGGGFKWAYVGIGLLVAGGVGAGVLLVQKGSNDGGSGGTTTVNPSQLPGPPTFP